MSKSSMRIVLVDPLGDLLFSGESMMASVFANDEAEEAIPQTRRSATSESGIFTTVPRDEDGAEITTGNPDEIRSPRSRAA